MTASPLIAPILTVENATSEQWDALWGARGFAGRGQGNEQLSQTLSLHYGGIPGDWVRAGHVPDVPGSVLRTLSVHDWRAWKAAIDVLRFGECSA